MAMITTPSRATRSTCRGAAWSAVAELPDAVEAEGTKLPPEQWLDGDFVFAAWLWNPLVRGHVKRVGQTMC